MIALMLIGCLLVSGPPDDLIAAQCAQCHAAGLACDQTTYRCEATCDGDAECGDDQVCDGHCAEPCDLDDCEDGYSCSGQHPAECATRCESESECADGYACDQHSERCRKLCVDDECPGGFSCSYVDDYTCFDECHSAFECRPGFDCCGLFEDCELNTCVPG